MRTNCEIPLCMLDKNNELNDFDFILFHLIKSNPTYRQWAYDQRRLHPERLMILDNSAYEFYVKGEELNLDEYADIVNDLQPDYYILPDVLRDREKTLKGTKEFLQKYIIEPKNVFDPKPLAVIQGNTDKELTQCLFDYISMNLMNVCIPFHIEFFKNIRYGVKEGIRDFYRVVYGELAEVDKSEDLEYSMGRVQWVENHKSILSLFNHVHFLGSHCPFEKHFLKKIKDNSTMDTGYPVKLAMCGVELGKEKEKPNIIIDDFLDNDIDISIQNLIENNVKTFKNT